MNNNLSFEFLSCNLGAFLAILKPFSRMWRNILFEKNLQTRQENHPKFQGDKLKTQVNIILCGLPASGKTTIGKKLAEIVKRPFFDTDQMIEAAYEKQYGQTKSCREIYQQLGEKLFRQLEKEQIAALPQSQSVIATGGGTLHYTDNLLKLKNSGLLVYLKVDPTIIWQRIAARGLPAYLPSENAKKSFYEIANKRMPLYEKDASLIIETVEMQEKEILVLLGNMTFN